MNKLGRRSFVTLAAATALALVGATAVAWGSSGGYGGPQSTGVSPDQSISITNCRAPRSDWINNDTNGTGPVVTTSTSFVDVTGVTKTITTNKPGCLIVTVSAAAYATSNELQWVSVKLDGSLLANPFQSQMNGDDDEDMDGKWARSHTAIFAFADVAAGTHTVSMVHRSEGGGFVALHSPSMHIQHR